MDTNVTRCLLHQWIDEVITSKHITNRWCSSEKLYNNFMSYTKLSYKDIITLNIFVRKLNKIQSYSGHIYKSVIHNSSGDRSILYLIHTEFKTTNDETILGTPPRVNRYIHSHSINNELPHPITPPDSRHCSNNNTTCRMPNMSVSNSQSHSTSCNPIQVSNTDYQTTTFPVLRKFGISVDISDPANISTLQSIMCELEKLNKTHDLFFQRGNNTIAKPFFVPNGFKSLKRFYDWENNGKGFRSMIDFMSNGNVDDSTEEPIAASYLMKTMIKYYPITYTHNNNEKGFTTPQHMSVIETAVVLSDMGVGDNLHQIQH